MNTATSLEAKPVATYNYQPTNNDVIETTPDPITSTHSSPQNSNVSKANLSQVDDSAIYANTQYTSNDTPKKILSRSNSIKNVIDADDEPIYYNESPSYVEPQPTYYEQPGKAPSNNLSSFS